MYIYCELLVLSIGSVYPVTLRTTITLPKQPLLDEARKLQVLLSIGKVFCKQDSYDLE